MSVYVCARENERVCVCARKCVSVRLCVSVREKASVCIRKCVNLCVCVWVWVCVCVCVCASQYMRASVCVHACVCDLHMVASIWYLDPFSWMGGRVGG
jgi:hypothetical protein